MIAERKYTPRINTGGNYCGHDPHNPVLKPLLPRIPNAPGILYRLRERLLAYYDAPRKKLPTLEACNNSTRLQRSERREALVRMLWCLVCHLELSSMRVGKPTEQGFRCPTLKTLAQRADLSMTRAARAMHDLIRAGIVVSSQLREVDHDGAYLYHPASRRIAPELFALFGLAVELKKQQDRATYRLKRYAQTIKTTATNLLHLKLAFNGRRSVNRRHPARVFERTSVHAQGPPETRIAKALQQLLHEHPDWNSNQVLTELKLRSA